MRRAALAGALLLLCGRAAAQTAREFVFDGRELSPAPQKVALAGSFNGWNRETTPMVADGTGHWRATVTLPDGIHFYKFVVNGETWITDPKSDKDLEESDGHGGVNSAILIGPDARKLPTVRAGVIENTVLMHDWQSLRDANLTDTTLRLRLRVQAGSIERATIWTQLPGAEPVKAGEMQRVGSRLNIDEYVGQVEFGSRPEKLGYWFEVVDGAVTRFIVPGAKPGTVALGEAPAAIPISQSTFVTPEWARDAVWYQIFPERFRNADPTNDPGDMWFERRTRWNSPWYSALPGEAAGEENFYLGIGNVWKRRYGGDLAGVREKLPYLRQLGVNAIYFNPIFEAESMHKYDTADFRHVDDNFGVMDEPTTAEFGASERTPPTAHKPLGNRKLFELDGTPVADGHVETDDPATWKWTKSDLMFLEFIAEARRQGFRVVIDGVFNHTGRAHPFFQDVLAKGKDSKYADWFAITDWGDPANWKPMDDPYAVHGKPGGIQWRAWDAVNGHLPAFRKDTAKGLAPGPYDHIMNITRRWLAPGGDRSRGIDGWRLDVPGDIPHGFWIDWRKVVKEANPDAYITGEIWDWAQPWLGGDQFDAVMNYRFAMAVQDFFVDKNDALSPSAFGRRLNEVIYSYPMQVALVQQNLFDSHDTDRFPTMLINPDRPYDGQNRLQDGAAATGYVDRIPTATERARQKQAVMFSAAFVGAPMFYYGNEAGMFSSDDPNNRMPMWWKDMEPFDVPEYRFYDDVFAFYQRAVAIRNTLPAVRRGGYRQISADDTAGVFIFERHLPGVASSVVYTVINRSPVARNVSFEVQTEAELFDYAAESVVAVVPAAEGADARPTMKVIGRPVRREGNTVRLTVEPFGTAILAAK
jgi:glycosidase